MLVVNVALVREPFVVCLIRTSESVCFFYVARFVLLQVFWCGERRKIR